MTPSKVSVSRNIASKAGARSVSGMSRAPSASVLMLPGWRDDNISICFLVMVFVSPVPNRAAQIASSAEYTISFLTTKGWRLGPDNLIFSCQSSTNSMKVLCRCGPATPCRNCCDMMSCSHLRCDLNFASFEFSTVWCSRAIPYNKSLIMSKIDTLQQPNTLYHKFSVETYLACRILCCVASECLAPL